MSVVGILALVMLLGAAAVLLPWSVRTRRGPLVRAALLAALVSSGTIGGWGVIAETLLGSGSGRAGLAGLASYAIFATIFYFELTIVQNVLGLTILANYISGRAESPYYWRSPSRRGFVPLGILYGEAVLVASAVIWVTLFALLQGRVDFWRYIPALLFSGRLPLMLHTMAVAGGVTAVGILMVLTRRSWDQRTAGILPPWRST